MRNMSFALTTEQVIAGTKTVTRRLGWLNLKPGDTIQPVKKCMGLKKGEKLDKLTDPLRVVSVRREKLRRMIDDMQYGFDECVKEGFANHPDLQWPSQFVEFFCATHRGCTLDSDVTRIEFEFL